MEAGEAWTVGGSFDPLSLSVEFSSAYQPDAGFEGPWQDALAKVPTPLIAHELAHLVHSLSTAAGIRAFLLAMDDVRVRTMVVHAAIAASSENRLRLPLNENQSTYMRDPDFARYSTLWARLRHVALFHSGNFYLTTRAEDEVGAGVWMQAAGRRKVGPLTNPWEMPFVDLTPYLSVERVVSPGFVHLTEGVAKIVETIQRRFTGEPGEQSPHGTKAVSLRDFVSRAESPIDPYYVTRIAFGAMRDPSSTMAPFDEYILLLSDMAMMFDPLLTPDAFSQLYGGLSDDDMDAARSGMSPFGIFLQLARLFWRHAPKLELSTELPLNEQAAAFQDGLLAAAGLQLSMSELTLA